MFFICPHSLNYATIRPQNERCVLKVNNRHPQRTVMQRQTLPEFSKDHKEAKAICHAFIGHPLIGVYNILDQTVHVMPSIRDRVRLYEEKGEITHGEKVKDAHFEARPLVAEEIAEYKKLNFAPRYLHTKSHFIDFLAPGHELLSSHEFLISRFMQSSLQNFPEYYRGFTVIPEIKYPVFTWKSSSLNPKEQQPDGQYYVMNEKLQDAVKAIMTPWFAPRCELEEVYIDTYEKDKATLKKILKEKEKTDFDKFTPLELGIYALYCLLLEETELARFLILNYPHIDLNVYHPKGDKRYPIHLLVADEKPDIELIKFVCEKVKINVAVENSQRRTALFIAAERGHINIATYFLRTPDLRKQFTSIQLRYAAVGLLKSKCYELANELLDNYPDILTFVMSEQNPDLDSVRYLIEVRKLPLEKVSSDFFMTSSASIVNYFIQHPGIIQQFTPEEAGRVLDKLVVNGRLEAALVLVPNRQDIKVDQGVINQIIMFNDNESVSLKLIKTLGEKIPSSS